MAKAVRLAADKHILPEAYLYGFIYAYTSAGRNSFLNGSYKLGAWWYFFPYAFLVKTNPGLFVLLLLAAFVFLKRRILFRKIVPFLVFMTVFLFFAVTGDLNIGHRHILPIYPMLFIIAGAASIYFKRGFLLSLPVILACVWAVAASLSVSPYFLAYFNFIAGGPSNGYKHLVDSSLDWGQGGAALKKYLDTNAVSEENVYFSHFGSLPPYDLCFRVKILPGYFDYSYNTLWNFRPGLYCISATMYQLVYYPGAAKWAPGMDTSFNALSFGLREFLPLLDKPAEMEKHYKDVSERTSFLRAYSDYKFFGFFKIILYLHEMKKEPIAIPGYSILVFELSEEELKEALSRPSVPILHQ